MFLLTWIVVAWTGQGLALIDINETDPPKFATHLDCSEFATGTTDRMTDWARGRFNASWQTPIVVSWRCQPEERKS